MSIKKQNPRQKQEFQIVKATIGDCNEIYGILLNCSDWLSQKGINQWKTPYPKDIFKKDIEKGAVYAFRKKNGEYLGTVSLLSKKPHYYPKDLFSDPTSAWYVCRLALQRSAMGQGLGAKMLKLVEAEALSKGINTLRLDVVQENPFLEQYYARAGYKKVKEDFIFGEKSVFMEKQIAEKVEQ